MSISFASESTVWPWFNLSDDLRPSSAPGYITKTGSAQWRFCRIQAGPLGKASWWESESALLLLLSHFSLSDSVQPHRRQPTRLPRPWDSPGKNTGVGCHFSHVQFFATIWTIAHQDSSVHGILQTRILEWVVNSFSRGSSQPRDRTRVSCISGRFFTIWATRDSVYGNGRQFEIQLTVKGFRLDHDRSM